MNLKEKDLDNWELLLDYCPELKEKSKPKDRDFFFNVLNTIIPFCIDKIVRNAILFRQYKSKIGSDIIVTPEFRDMFTDDLSLLGSKCNTI